MSARNRAVDFREFLFTATGAETDLAHLTPIDLYDNLVVELDRLAAVVDLLEARAEPLEAPGGVALLLKDIHRRARMILELSGGRKP